jgi:16S rRNA processing protein RimM
MVPNGPDDLLAIAYLVRPHGIHGEVSAIPLAPPVLDPDGLIRGRVLTLRDPAGGARTVAGLGVRPHQDRWLVTLEGIDSMDEADRLRGLDLCLRRAELPELPEGWFWEDDLARCRVVDAALGEIGTVAGLNVSAFQPQLELRRPDGALVLIPWVRAYIAKVDLGAGEIRTALPADFPGLS